MSIQLEESIKKANQLSCDEQLELIAYLAQNVRNNNLNSLIQKTPEVCGGNAIIKNTRIPVWTLVSLRKLGADDQELLESYPSLTLEELNAAWWYYQNYQTEIEQTILAQNQDE